MTTLRSILKYTIIGASLIGSPLPHSAAGNRLHIACSSGTSAPAFVRSSDKSGNKGEWVALGTCESVRIRSAELGNDAWYDIAFRLPDGNFIYVPDLPLNGFIASTAQRTREQHLVAAYYGNWNDKGFKRLSSDERIAEVYTTADSATLVAKLK